MSPREDPRIEELRADIARVAALHGLPRPSEAENDSDYAPDDPDAAERRRANKALRRYARDVDRAVKSLKPADLDAATSRLLNSLNNLDRSNRSADSSKNGRNHD